MGLDVRSLAVAFPALTAVSDVDLSVPEGEVLAVLGPSGCGKSTLLRAIAGLERPTSGTVAWNGSDLDRVAVHRRGFGMVFQEGQLFPHRDVAGNVEFGLRMRSAPRARRSARVSDLLELVGLAGYQRRRVTDLSGGEAQRVALARALAAEPRLLLLDEPLAALDRVLREQLAVDLAGLLKRNDATAVVVTHDHDEAFTLADRVAVMVGGRIRQVDVPQRLWRYPATDEVAAFLGYSTILPAHIRDGVATCALGRVEVPAFGAASQEAEADDSVRLGLRAAGVRAVRAEAGADPAEPGIGVVRERVRRQDHVRLAVTVPQAPEAGCVEAVAQDFSAGDGAAEAPGVGEAVRLSLDRDGVAVVGGRSADSRGIAEFSRL